MKQLLNMKKMLSSLFKNDADLVFKVMASPIFWRNKAEELKFAADLMWPNALARLEKISKEPDISKLDPDTFSICLSLIGFSTECLFKGSAIRSNPEFVSNGTLAKRLRKHDLIKLANLAKIELSQHERIFCQQAYKAMVVDSRYPVALESEPRNGATEIGKKFLKVFITDYIQILTK